MALTDIIGGITGVFIANRWLGNFTSHINPGIDAIILSFIIGLFMALIPFSFKKWKVIPADPVISIKTSL